MRAWDVADIAMATGPIRTAKLGIDKQYDDSYLLWRLRCYRDADRLCIRASLGVVDSRVRVRVCSLVCLWLALRDLAIWYRRGHLGARGAAALVDKPSRKSSRVIETTCLSGARSTVQYVETARTFMALTRDTHDAVLAAGLESDMADGAPPDG